MPADQTIENTVLPSYVVPLMITLRTQGVDPMEVLESLGIDPAKFANPGWRFRSIGNTSSLAFLVDGGCPSHRVVFVEQQKLKV